MATEEQHEAIPLQFQLLFNWEVEATQEAIFKNKNRMYPAFKVELYHTSIYRLIHHEFERHFFSAGQLFKACGLTLTEGFFLFNMKLSEFEVDFLISQFPYCDVWISVEQGRSMAAALGVEEELALLLGEELELCYSSDNVSRNEMMHNWVVPSIPNLQYSTRALLETSFAAVELLEPSNRKIRTQISRSNRQHGMVMKDRTENGLVRWQVWAYEQFLQNKEGQEDVAALPPVLDRSGAVWDALQGILSDLQTMNRNGGMTIPRVLSDNMVVGNMPLKKEYIGHSLLLQQLYIAVMAEKIMNELERHKLPQQQTELLEEVIRQPPELTSPATSSLLDGNEQANGRNMLFHDRMDLLEQDLYRVKRRAKKKFDEVQLYQDELILKINELNQWKLQAEKSRKSERVWMLMVILTVIFAVLSLRSLYF